jgi:lipoprotein-releasing system ATP-binding protein
MEKIILKTVDIHKNYGDINILKGINLELKKGESLAIMGASGEGKTTLLHILGALESPSKGEIYINEEKLEKHNAAKIRNSIIGYIFQTYNLLEDLSLQDNVQLPAMIARVNSPESQKRALDLLKEVNLEKQSHLLAKVLSGGEKQRAAIARSFCNDPQIILADEPSGNLDHTNSKIIHELLISFVKKKNKSLIVVTHDEELANLCDKRFILKGGYLYGI